MPSILAQLAGADAAHVKDFLLILLALSAPVLSVMGLVVGRRARIEPDPLRVQHVEGLVSLQQFERCRTAADKTHDMLFAKISAVDRRSTEQFNALRTEMHDMELRLNASDEKRVANVHERVNEILAAENETRGTLATLSEQLRQLALEVRSQ